MQNNRVKKLQNSWKSGRIIVLIFLDKRKKVTNLWSNWKRMWVQKSVTCNQLHQSLGLLWVPQKTFRQKLVQSASLQHLPQIQGRISRAQTIGWQPSLQQRKKRNVILNRKQQRKKAKLEIKFHQLVLNLTTRKIDSRKFLWSLPNRSEPVASRGQITGWLI